MDNKKREKLDTAQDKDNGIQWHPAFFGVTQLELDEYSQYLEFISEYPLTRKPLQIDVVIIKKTKDIVIKKNIASIFKKDNIVEYKSPSDHISIDDFYHVYAYACLYASLKKGDIHDMSITFVGSRYPRKLLEHLREERKYTVEKKMPGVYIVSGDIFPIQIINSRELSFEENIWLKGLYHKLDTLEMRRIVDKAAPLRKDNRVKTYMNVITEANIKSFKEVMEMRASLLARDQVLRDLGYVARWTAEGHAEGRVEGQAEIIHNLLKNGFSPKQTAQLSGLDLKTIKSLQSKH